MPKGDDGVMDNLDSRVEHVEGFSRKERKGRRDFLPRWERMISWREELELPRLRAFPLNCKRVAV